MKLITCSIALTLYCTIASAQITINGCVVSANNNTPLPGTSVSLSNSKHTVVTERDGTFILTTAYGVDTILFTYTGYIPLRLPINKTTRFPLVAILEPVVKRMDEVTINTGYQTLPRERATGSFDIIDNRLYNQQTGTDVLSRLESISNGLIFEKKTNPGTSNIMIRGLSTIQGPKAPLIILDNFPYEGNINNLNPNDVENITILKDAAAASIWGTRAGNGVIVITTKKGKFNQLMHVQVQANATIGQKPDLFYLKPIASADFIEVEKMLYSKGFFTAMLRSTSKPPVSPVVELLVKRDNGAISPTEADSRINALKGFDVRNDFNDHVYAPSVNQQYAVNLQGGGNNIAWLLSAGADKNLSNLKDAYNRINLHNENAFKISPALQLTAGIFYTQSKSKAGKTGYTGVTTTNGSIPPYTRLADDAGTALPVIKTYRQAFLDTAGRGKLLDWNYYPLDDYKYTDNSALVQDIIGTLGLNYKINKKLAMDLTYRYERQTTAARTLYNVQSYFVRDMINTFSQYDGTGGVIQNVPYGAVLDNGNALLVSQNGRAQLSYNARWKKSGLVVIAGAETRNNHSTASSFRAYGYNDDILTTGNVDFLHPYKNLVTGRNAFINNSINFSEGLNRYVSYFANAAYTYNDKYTLSVSGRRDASNLFGVATNDKWSPLWSAGGSWEISKEKFYTTTKLPYLRMRATYGTSGNADPARSGITTINYIGTSFYVSLPAARIDQFENPGLRWEKISMLNLGLDFRTLNNLLSGFLEFYTKKGTDLFGDTPIDYTAVGTPDLVKNVAAIKGYGWDIALNSVNIQRKITWVTNLNFNVSRDKVVNYYVSSTQGSNFVNGGTSISAIVGKPVYSVYAYKWAGLDPATGNPQGFVNGQLSTDYTSITGSSTTINDLVYKGPAFPVISGSLGNTVSWKNISLTLRVTYKFGDWFQRSSINYGALFANRKGNADYAKRWQAPGDEKFTNVPSMVYPNNGNRDNFYTGSETLVEKGDNIRLQYVTLSYNLVRTAFLKLPFTNAQFYINANNLGILWRANKKGIDPDYQDTALPAVKNIAFGIRLDF